MLQAEEINFRASLLPGAFQGGVSQWEAFIALSKENGHDILPEYEVTENAFMRSGKVAEQRFIDTFTFAPNECGIVGKSYKKLSENSPYKNLVLSGTTDVIVKVGNDSVKRLFEELENKILVDEFLKHDEYLGPESSIIIEHKKVHSDASFARAAKYYAPQCEAYSALFLYPTILVVNWKDQYHLAGFFLPSDQFWEKTFELAQNYYEWFEFLKGPSYHKTLEEILKIKEPINKALQKIELLENTAKYLAKRSYKDGEFSDDLVTHNGATSKVVLTLPTHSIKASGAGLEHLRSLNNEAFLTTTKGANRYAIKYQN